MFHNHESYKNYGARGITVCEQWRDKKLGYANFKEWSELNGYKDDLSIDRINNEKGYSPENCRWVTFIEQCNNKRNNRKINYNGREYTCAELARKLAVSYKKIYKKIKEQNYVTGNEN